MFIREVEKKNKGYEKKFIYHVLVESYRTIKGPRQRNILNLGKLIIPKDQWKILANRIEEITIGQKPIFELDAEMEALATHYASLIIDKQLNEQPFIREEDSDQPDYAEVDLNSMKTHNSRSIGAEYVSLSILNRLGLDRILSGLGFNKDQIKIAKLLIVGRMVHPASELSTYHWAQDLSAIGELLQLKVDEISHNPLYRVSDLLIDNKDKIESRLNQIECDIFMLNEKIILYDLTNTYFESSRISRLKKYGRSKDKRNDQPLVTLGLVIDERGFPKQSHIFEGNISEIKTLEKILEKLDKNNGFARARTVIMDAGIASDENIELIKKRGHDYIAVSRNKPIDALPDEGFVVIRHNQENKVEARLFRQGDEVILFCRSDLKKIKEESMRTRFQERFETDLKYAQESLHKKGGTKNYLKVIERIGRLKQKHLRVAYFYNIKIKEKDGVATDISWHLKDDKKIDDRFSGTYYLRSNRFDLNEKEIWNLYISLTDVEDSFRSMKSELGLRPNFHQKDERIMGHMFITVLAHHVVNSIQSWLHNKDIYLRWDTIRKQLSTQNRSTSQLMARDGRRIWMRNTSEPDAFHYLVADALSISPKPLARKKMKI